MLEDRKFYYPVTGEAPAWEMVHAEQDQLGGRGPSLRAAGALAVDDPGRPGRRRRCRRSLPSSASTRPSSRRARRARGCSRSGWASSPAGSTSGGSCWRARGSVNVSLAWGGGASDRQTVTIDALEEGLHHLPARFHREGLDRQRPSRDRRLRGGFRVGTVSLMPADNVHGWRADTLALLNQLDAPVYRWPGGNFVSGYDWKDGIGDRRPPSAAQEPGLERHRAQRRRHRRVHDARARARHRAVHRRQHRARQDVGGRGGGRVPERRGHDADGEAAREERARGAVRRALVGHRQRDVRRLAARPHAALEYVKKHQAVVDGMRKVDPKIVPIAVGRGRRVEQDHAVRRHRAHGPPERAHLLAGQARRAGARRPGDGRHQEDRGRAPRVPQGAAGAARARTSGSRSTSGTTGTAPTSTASSARATSCRTGSAPRPRCTSSSATATSS